MNVLALDTSSQLCSVMLLVGSRAYFCHEGESRQHSRHILLLLEEVLEQGGVTPASLDLLAWNAGPGSFTGLRIGASVIQALSYSFGLPILSLSSLEVLAYSTLQDSGASGSGRIAVAVDARMNGIYWASFSYEGGDLKRQEEDQLLSAASFQPESLMLGENWIVAGDAWDSTFLSVTGYRPSVVSATAAEVAALAATKNRVDWIGKPADCMPHYVRDATHWQKRQLRSGI